MAAYLSFKTSSIYKHSTRTSTLITAFLHLPKCQIDNETNLIFVEMSLDILMTDFPII